MKNPGTTTDIPDSWAPALAGFDRWLATRGMAERTRRAYGTDVGDLARWAEGQGMTARTSGVG